MRMAVVTLSGTVENVIEADPSFQMTDRVIVPATDEVGTGWTYSGGVFGPPPAAPEPTQDELREGFPTLNPAQIRLGLLNVGITESMVDAALDGNPEGLTEWKYRPSYRRLHPLVASLSAVFELSDSQVDALWLWAAEL